MVGHIFTFDCIYKRIFTKSMRLKFSKSSQLKKKGINLPKPKKVDSKGKSYWKKKAWAQFSIYIRRKYIEYQDYVRCYTCGTLKPWKQMQAGHGIGGRSNAVLFDERLVKPQCAGCNIFGGGQYRIFTRKLIDELGLEKYDEMVKNSTTLMPLKDFQFKEIYEKYKTLNKEIV